LVAGEDLPEFKAKYLKKHREDIRGTGRKGTSITLRLYNVAVLNDAPVMNVAGGQGCVGSCDKLVTVRITIYIQ